MSKRKHDEVISVNQDEEDFAFVDDFEKFEEGETGDCRNNLDDISAFQIPESGELEENVVIENVNRHLLQSSTRELSKSRPITRSIDPTLVPWSEEEDSKLTEAVDLYVLGNPPTVLWDKVSEHLDSIRNPEQCERRWMSYLKYRRPDNSSLPWTKDADDRLEKAVNANRGHGLRGGVNWDKVREELGYHRSNDQYRTRWSALLQRRIPLSKTTPWTQDEDDLLCLSVSRNEGKGRRGSVNWSSVSNQFNGLRTATQCANRWNRTLRNRGTAATAIPWTDDEDERLRQAAAEFFGQGLRGGVDWKKVAERMNFERTVHQYGHRWNRVLKSKGFTPHNVPWSSEEDERLMEGVAMFEGQGLRGAVDWNKVSEYMGGDRSAQQCCHRWSAVLKHKGEGKSAAWNFEEDCRLAEAVKLYANQGIRGGINWMLVSEHLNRERNPQQCSHRWNRVLQHRTSETSMNCSTWSDEEDIQLTEAVALYEGQGLRGGVDWGKVSTHLNHSRTTQQYCTRWNRVLKNKHLTPSSSIWTAEDDHKLTNAVTASMGRGRGGTVDWIRVTDLMGGGRTREQLCGRWNGVLKVRKQRDRSESNQHPCKHKEGKEGRGERGGGEVCVDCMLDRVDNESLEDDGGEGILRGGQQLMQGEERDDHQMHISRLVRL
jgi:hypothetical protein